MEPENRKGFLTNIEDRFHFPFSRFVWNIIVLVGFIALICGILYLFYGLLPAIKNKVVKEEYPPIELISSEDVKSCYNNDKDVTKITNTETQSATTKVKVDFDTLKVALPEDRYTWRDTPALYQNVEYWYGYTERVLVRQASVGLETRLQNKLDEMAPDNLMEQQNIVNKSSNLLLNFNLDYRLDLLNISLRWLEKCPAERDTILGSWEKWAAFSKEKNNTPERLFYTIADIGSSYCNDGLDIVNLARPVIALGDSNNKSDLLRYAASAFGIFDTISEYKSIIDHYMTLSELHKEAIKSFPCYVDLVAKQNEERRAEIRRIEEKYAGDLVASEMDLELKKAKHSLARKQGLMAAGAAAVMIAFFSLMLVLLSIQRTLRSIESLSANQQAGRGLPEPDNTPTATAADVNPEARDDTTIQP